ncbi:MAG TPA: SOS response-associated peptidase family protein [Edaphobacter sp.]|nr:SOS response-associated peptidase family protein [Edaphobacter sp.]
MTWQQASGGLTGGAAICGRYVRRSDKQRIAEYFQVHGPSLPDFGPSWNVAPQTFQPVIRLNRDTGEREIVLMRWGLVLLANSPPTRRQSP